MSTNYPYNYVFVLFYYPVLADYVTFMFMFNYHKLLTIQEVREAEIRYTIYTSDNQFGFKAKHSTDMCISAVKSVVKYYNYFHSPVYICFLDASKAFDRINHWTLFSKLIAGGVPCPLVRIIMFWYKTQTICVKWGKLCSSYFSVSNGVRQGGILFPKLFFFSM